MGGGSFVPKQQNFHWMKDDGAEPIAQWANENVTFTLFDNGDILRLRITIAETGGKGANNISLKFEWSINDVDFNTPGPASDWDYANGQAIEGNAVTTNKCTDTAGKGQYVETSGGAVTFDFLASLSYEFDFAITPGAAYSDNTLYYFRILIDDAEVVLNVAENHPNCTTALDIEDTELVVSKASHAHSADAPVLIQAHTLVINDADHAHAVDAPVLTQAHTLVVSDASHIQTADEPILTEHKTLATNEADHAHVVDEPVLVVEGAEDTELVVSESLHIHNADVPVLTQIHTLAVGDSDHLHTVDPIILIQAFELLVADCSHGHLADNIVLNQIYQLAVAGSEHSQIIDPLILSQAHQLAMSDGGHNHLADNIVIELIVPGIIYPTWLWGWDFRKKITIQHEFVDGDLTNFPVYVPIKADADFHEARADGYDIRFTLSDGKTLLKYEREHWSGGNGSPATAHFWVMVPSILASGGGIIYIYYGKSDAPDGQDAPNVWDANFKGVWHMKDITPSTVADSTGVNDGIKKAANEPIEVDGKVYKGQEYDALDDFIKALTPQNPRFSLEMWMRHEDKGSISVNLGLAQAQNGGDVTTQIPALKTIAAKLRLATRDLWGRIVQSDGTMKNLPQDGTAIIDWDTIYFVRYIADGTKYRLFVNEVEKKSVSYDGTILALDRIFIGRQGAEDWQGMIDEVRMSNIVRTIAWYNFQYHNINEDDNEITWGDQEFDITGLIVAKYKGYLERIG